MKKNSILSKKMFKVIIFVVLALSVLAVFNGQLTVNSAQAIMAGEIDTEVECRWCHCGDPVYVPDQHHLKVGQPVPGTTEEYGCLGQCHSMTQVQTPYPHYEFIPFRDCVQCHTSNITGHHTNADYTCFYCHALKKEDPQGPYVLSLNNTCGTYTDPVNDPPVADAGQDRTFPPMYSIYFDAGASHDPEGTSLLIHWDFGNGDTYDCDSGTTTCGTFYDYPNYGIYTATLTVTDRTGLSATDTAQITVPGSALPVADAGVDRSVSAPGVAVYFNGEGSYDPDGNITEYIWDFGDEKSGSGAALTHVYSRPGVFTVTLRVIDNNGQQASDTVLITVGNMPPPVPKIVRYEVIEGVRVDIPETEIVFVGENVNFDGSYPDDYAYFNWNFGNGKTSAGTDLTSTSYPNPGIYTVTLDVNSGGLWGTDTAQIRVVKAPFAVIAGGDLDGAVTGTPVTFDGRGSYDPDGTIVSYRWEIANFFGEGTGAIYSGPVMTHSFTSPTWYYVILYVIDNDGVESLSSVRVICIAPPVAVIAGAEQRQATIGQAVAFDGSQSSTQVGTITNYQWDFGDVTTGTGSNVSKSYPYAGTYTVKLTVTNTNGLTSTDTVQVKIINPAADKALLIKNLTDGNKTVDPADGSSNKVDITSAFGNFINTSNSYIILNSSKDNVISMQEDIEANTVNNISIRLKVKTLPLDSKKRIIPQTIKIYAYKSDMLNINTAQSVSATISATGDKVIDVTALKSLMSNFGKMKFRIVNASTTMTVSNGDFVFVF